MMNPKRCARYITKVPVPLELRLAVYRLCGTKRPDDDRVGRTRAAQILGIATCTVEEMVSPGGVVRPSTLEKVKTRLAELAQNGAA
jgi:hypothetical protein